MIDWINDDLERAKAMARETKRPIFLWLHAPT